MFTMSTSGDHGGSSGERSRGESQPPRDADEGSVPQATAAQPATASNLTTDLAATISQMQQAMQQMRVENEQMRGKPLDI